MTILDPKVFTLSIPAVSALVAMLIIIYDVFEQGGENRRIKIKLALFLASTVVTTISAFMYFFYPELFIYINGLYMFSLMGMPVFLYAFIFKITRTDKPESFSNLHFIAPTLLALFLIIVSLFTPIEEQMLTIKGNGAYNGGSRLFFFTSNGKLFIRLIFSIIYIVLIFMRLPHYRKYIVNYSSNDSKGSLRWVPIYLFAFIATIPVPLFGLFMPRDTLVSNGFAFFHIFILILQHSFLTFHVIKGHYILPENSQHTTCPAKPHDCLPANEENITLNNIIDSKSVNGKQKLQKEEQTKSKITAKKEQLTREQFECYIKTKRPYLNPDLKITDLVNDLIINRTYISMFINAEYGLNFSNFINQCRLNEYNRLRKCNDYDDKSNAELVQMAGFGSYRSYSRALELSNKKER